MRASAFLIGIRSGLVRFGPVWSGLVRFGPVLLGRTGSGPARCPDSDSHASTGAASNQSLCFLWARNSFFSERSSSWSPGIEHTSSSGTGLALRSALRRRRQSPENPIRIGPDWARMKYTTGVRGCSSCILTSISTSKHRQAPLSRATIPAPVSAAHAARNECRPIALGALSAMALHSAVGLPLQANPWDPRQANPCPLPAWTSTSASRPGHFPSFSASRRQRPPGTMVGLRVRSDVCRMSAGVFMRARVVFVLPFGWDQR